MRSLFTISKLVDNGNTLDNMQVSIFFFFCDFKWLSYFPVTLGAGAGAEGVLWTQPQKTPFPVEFSGKNYTITVCQIMIIC